MHPLLILLIVAALVGLVIFLKTPGDLRDRLTEAVGGAGGTFFVLLYFLVQLAILAGMGWLAWKFLAWIFG